MLPQGLVGHEDLQVDDGIRVAAAVDQCRGPLTEREEAQLLEPSGDRQQPPLVGILAVRPARPEAERSVVPGHRIGGSVDSGLGQRHLEVGGVEARPVEHQLVAVLPSDEVLLADGGAEPRHVAHHGPAGALGRVVARPDRLDQPVGADDRVVVGQQRGQQPPLLRAPECDRMAVRQGADGPLQHGEANLRGRRPPALVSVTGRPHEDRVEAKPAVEPASTRPPGCRQSAVPLAHSTISRTSDDTRISPPWAWLAMRAATTTGRPNRSLSSTVASPVCIPIRIRSASVGCDRAWASTPRMISIEHSTAERALGNASMKPSPSALTSMPPLRSTCRRTSRLCTANNAIHRSSPSASARRVDCSMSENTMVTVPPDVSIDGNGTAMSCRCRATMSIEVRRSGSPPLSATRSVAPSSSRRQRPNFTTSPGWSTTVPASTEPPTDVPFVLPRSCTDTRPPTALRRKCRRESRGSPRSKPSQSRPTSSGLRTTTCSGARPGSVIVTVGCAMVVAIPESAHPAGGAGTSSPGVSIPQRSGSSQVALHTVRTEGNSMPPGCVYIPS